MNNIIALALGISSMLLAPAAIASAEHGETGTAPDKALRMLQEGNARFVEGRMQHAHQDRDQRHTLVTGQHPDAIVLSCSDSRLPPEVLFDRGLGEIFVIRVAGNALGNAAVASIEYAVEHLGTRLIVIMGHESCGAIKATLSTPETESAGSHDLDILISEIRANLTGIDASVLKHDKTLREPARRNVDSVSKRLLERSHIVRHAVESGKVQIARALYNLDSGKVEFWGISSQSKPGAVHHGH